MVMPQSKPTPYEPSLGCQRCFARAICGGIYDAGTMDCFDHCCKQPTTCTYLCPHSDRFAATWQDTNGINLTGIRLAQQPITLPAYIPLIQHGNRRSTPLLLPYAAITTFDALRRQKKTRKIQRDPSVLRRTFHLDEATPLLFSSIAPDNDLERYWRNRHNWGLLDAIKALCPATVIAPNFSLFRDVPRLDHLANIKRSLLCAEELAREGLVVIPYLAGITTHDWEHWRDFLREHRSITVVCKEFQTGPKKRAIGNWHIDHLTRLQDGIGRALHVIALGGRRHERLRERLNVTIVDSTPFMRTMNRHRLTNTGWISTPTMKGEPLDDLLRDNIAAYRQMISHSSTKLALISKPQRPQTQPALIQLPLFPDQQSPAA